MRVISGEKCSPLCSAFLPSSPSVTSGPALPGLLLATHRTSSAGLRRPGVDPDRLLAGALAVDSGMGDVRVRVLLRGHHHPARPVHDGCPRRGGFLGHPGEFQLEMSEGVGSVDPLPQEAAFSHAGQGCPVDASHPCSKIKLARPSALSYTSTQGSLQPGGQEEAQADGHCLTLAGPTVFSCMTALFTDNQQPNPLPILPAPAGACSGASLPPGRLVSILSWVLALAAQWGLCLLLSSQA